MQASGSSARGATQCPINPVTKSLPQSRRDSTLGVVIRNVLANTKLALTKLL
ncbi:hypothetical protein GBAR_LOCUS19828 [Geodia barretti]|uniref:Uncharacterized protein n=1 Tax=Geodia barretti TaxID=519541 RepID=A0AA35SSE9_GEOBA|nr:hypothetical protein GBAR_LOCUS19828 [Geodia barretti]